MSGLTVEDISRVIEELEKTAIKPYKGFYGIDGRGLFEIKDEEQFQQLKKNTTRIEILLGKEATSGKEKETGRAE